MQYPLSLGLVSAAIGAVAAIAAIFLKESVQVALQRRALAWQVAAYFMRSKSVLLRDHFSYMLYSAVESRSKELLSASRLGSEVFRKRLSEQSDRFQDVRARVKGALEDEIRNPDSQFWTALASVPMTAVMEEIREQRRALLDGKSFPLDRDAAVLGPTVAIYAVQYRSASSEFLAYLLIGADMVKGGPPNESKALLGVVDNIIVAGNDAFVAHVALERAVDATTRRSLMGLVLDVLRGR